MSKKSLFVAIEGLDGSGKTTIARHLAYFAQTALNEHIKLTFEPHDPSAGGLFIRQILEKKIRNFSNESLMMAFASNRLDHCDREINPWLNAEGERVLICDRYYLSSLVYQSNDTYSFEDVMTVNNKARKPDLTIFMNVSNQVCYQRMQKRDKPEELFEKDLSETREKYYKAINFLRETRNENIVVIEANGTMKEVLEATVNVIKNECSDDLKEKFKAIETYEIPEANSFNIQTNAPETFVTTANQLAKEIKENNIASSEVENYIQSSIHKLSFNNKGLLFFNYVKFLGYNVLKKHAWTHLDAFELSYTIPGGLTQRGTALLIKEHQRYDVILEAVGSLEEISDFMFVFSPGPAELVTQYYEREIMTPLQGKTTLFPNLKQITEATLQAALLDKIKVS